MPRLLWLSHFVPYPPKSGALLRSYNLLRELSKNWDVHVLSFCQPAIWAGMYPSTSDALTDAREHLGRFCHIVDVLDIPSESWRIKRPRLALSAMASSLPVSVAWLRSRTMASTLKQVLAANHYDLVHFDTVSLAPYADCIGNTPATMTHHNIESDMLLRRAENERNPLMRTLYSIESRKLRSYEESTAPLFDIHIVCSDTDGERLSEISPEARILTIPNGVDVEFFKPQGLEEEAGRLIFAGGLSWYPNRSAMQFFTTEVWPELHRQLPHVTFDLIGQNPPNELISVGETDPAFRVHGFVDDVRPYIETAAIYVCPIFDGGGTKLKLLDAFSMHKAVVCHPTAAEGLDVEDGRHVLFATTALEFIEAIQRLLADSDLRAQLGRNARRLVENQYRYSVIGEKLSMAYHEIGR